MRELGNIQHSAPCAPLRELTGRFCHRPENGGFDDVTGLAAAAAHAESMAALFRSYRDTDISCFAARVEPGGQDESDGNVIEGKALPAITHNPESMLKAQRAQDRERLSRREESNRRESTGTVTGAVQRAAAMHMERSRNPPERPGDSSQVIE